MARTFVALWPPVEGADRLAAEARAAAERSGARPMPAADLHVTLAFIGELPDDALEPLGRTLHRALQRAAPGVPGAGDAIELDRIGSFRGANLCWLGPSAPPDWLPGLAQAVRDALDAAGVAFDRKPFAPHVTLARGARLPPAQIPPIAVRGWRVALVRSAAQAGAPGTGRYRVAAWLS